MRLTRSGFTLKLFATVGICFSITPAVAEENEKSQATTPARCNESLLNIRELALARGRAIFSDDRKLLWGYSTKNVGMVLFDTATGEELGHYPQASQVLDFYAFVPNTNGVLSIQQQENKRSGEIEYTLTLLDTKTKELRGLFSQPDMIRLVAASPTGDQVLASTLESLNVAKSMKPLTRIFHIDLITGKSKTLIETDEGVTHLNFSPDGKSFVYSSQRSSDDIVVHHYTFESNIDVPLFKPGSTVLKSGFSEDGKKVFFLCPNSSAGELSVFDISTKKLLIKSDGAYEDAKFSADGSSVLGVGNQVRLIRDANGKKDVRFNFMVERLDFTGKTTEPTPLLIEEAIDGSRYRLETSVDGKYVLLSRMKFWVDELDSVRVFESQNFLPVLEIDTVANLGQTTFSADGKSLLVLSRDGKLGQYSLQLRTELPSSSAKPEQLE